VRGGLKAPFASYWFAAAESGYAKARDWQDWADRIILAMETPPMWVLDLATAKNAEQVWDARTRQTKPEWAAQSGIIVDESIIGYLWLRYRRGDISFYDFAELAGRRADGGWVDYECEEFYAFLNRLDAGEAFERVETDAENLVAPLVTLAQEQWETLARTEQV
jgi:hypothetical protein